MSLGIIDEVEQELIDSTYTHKVETPVYTPSYRKPAIHELYIPYKVIRLLNNIEKSTLDDDQKQFLRYAAYRHCVLNFSKIADYYAHSNEEMQDLMEQSALVIIDFNKAIEYSYVRLNDELADFYTETQTQEKEATNEL